MFTQDEDNQLVGIQTCEVTIDVGGTFTDLHAKVHYTDGTCEEIRRKVSSTDPFFDEGVMQVIAESGIDPKDITCIKHGTTVGINAITQGNLGNTQSIVSTNKMAKVGLITTAGFKDVLAIGTGSRPPFFVLDYEKRKPLVPRHLRKEVPGRMNCSGEVEEPLNLESLVETIQYFKAQGVEAVAISMINAYANPQFEEEIAAKVRELWPEVAIVISTEASSEAGEYARTCTAVLSAGIKPVVTQYLTRLQEKLTAKGFESKQFYIMKSNGGVDTVESIIRSPVAILESGPAAGFIAASMLDEKVIGFDVGGTTAKLMVSDGRLPVISTYNVLETEELPGIPLLTAALDIKEFGNGGGSIASVDEFGHLRVGPESAGAIPGPVSYGRGGEKVTITDACLALGWINPDDFCNGQKANMQKVFAALNKLADELRIEPEKKDRAIITASKVLQVAQNNMHQMLKSATIGHGYDPRKFSLVAFGGGGAIHAPFLSQKLGLKKVIVPNTASIYSASGMLQCDLRRDFSKTMVRDISDEDFVDDLQKELKLLIEKAEKTYIDEGISKESILTKVYLNIRYQGQGHELEIPLDLEEIDARAIGSSFSKAYFEKYEDAPDERKELARIRVKSIVKIEKQLKNTYSAPTASVCCSTREIYFLEKGKLNAYEAKIYRWEAISINETINGPAIVEGEGSTVLILPGMKFSLDPRTGNLQIGSPTLVDKVENTAPHAHDSRSLVEVKRSVSEYLEVDSLITREIIQESWREISKRMFEVMKHTARSPIIYKVLDMSTGVTDADGNLLSSGAGLPAFSCLLDFPVKAIIRSFKSEGIYPGDIFVVNCPYSGGVTHLNDFVIVKPVFHQEEIVSWVAVIAHQSDIGGIAKGSMSTQATSLGDEGSRLKPQKFHEKGREVKYLMQQLEHNSKQPGNLRADIAAMVAAVRRGHDSISDIVKEYGVKSYFAAIEDYFTLGERLTREGLNNLPLGDYPHTEAQDAVLGNLAVTVRVGEDKTGRFFEVDLTEMPTQTEGPYNLSKDGAIVAARIIMKSITSPRTACNWGSFKPLRVKTKLGTFCDPEPKPNGDLPASGFYFETFLRIHDCIWHALAKKIPGILPAGHFSTVGGTIHGDDTLTIVEAKEGGWGASKDKDGANAIFSAFHGDTVSIGSEWMELLYNVDVLCYEFNPDQSGHGAYRGGRGIAVDMRMRSDASWVTLFYTRSVIPPWGLNGGGSGSTNYGLVINPEQSARRYAQVTDLKLKKGNVLRLVTGNGAGYGPPIRRRRSAVEEDLRNGMITLETAETEYAFFQRANPKIQLFHLNRLKETLSGIDQKDFTAERLRNELVPYQGQNRLLACCGQLLVENKEAIATLANITLVLKDAVVIDKAMFMSHIDYISSLVLIKVDLMELTNRPRKDSSPMSPRKL